MIKKEFQIRKFYIYMAGAVILGLLDSLMISIVGNESNLRLVVAFIYIWLLWLVMKKFGKS